MDGGGRFLRQIGRRGATGLARWPHAHPALAWVLSFAVLGSAGALGVVCGGQYDAFVAPNGAPLDMAARSAGFDIQAVSISGIKELSETQVLEMAGIGPKKSLALLDAQAMRARLLRSPFIQEASVRKLFPGQLELKITEREPFALWQMDGKITVIARDGTVLDPADPEKFTELPFVVGADANLHVEAFAALLDAMGDVRGKVKAGVYVAGRRWNLRLASGMDVKLPTENPQKAAQKLAQLQRTSRILDKDIAAIDLRQPGRLVARLTIEAADARAEAQKTKGTKAGAV